MLSLSQVGSRPLVRAASTTMSLHLASYNVFIGSAALNLVAER